jgi:hypothetical protein
LHGRRPLVIHHGLAEGRSCGHNFFASCGSHLGCVRRTNPDGEVSG